MCPFTRKQSLPEFIRGLGQRVSVKLLQNLWFVRHNSLYSVEQEQNPNGKCYRITTLGVALAVMPKRKQTYFHWDKDHEWWVLQQMKTLTSLHLCGNLTSVKTILHAVTDLEDLFHILHPDWVCVLDRAYNSHMSTGLKSSDKLRSSQFPFIQVSVAQQQKLLHMAI